MKQKVCVALDVPDAGQAIALAKRLSPWVGLFKIGSQLFAAEGPNIVRAIQETGSRVFLDLKLHDIPNTVIGAATAAVDHGVFMLDVHALGGFKMMRALSNFIAEYAQRKQIERPLLVAITILTSMSEEDLRRDLLVDTPLDDYVAHLSKQTKLAGLDGVVCSQKEIEIIRSTCGSDFILVVPGIRPAWAVKHDQERITTPEQALTSGADYIVIGRPIIAHESPELAAEKILDSIEHLGER